MLCSLHIRNYVLIDSLDVEFPEGLIIISGPTGAGKSIIIGALGLLAGGRADNNVIAAGAQTCIIEGAFRAPDPSVEAFCNDNDLNYAGGELSLRRVLSVSGRSRCFVNDEPCPLPILEQLGAMLFDIHSQHDTLLLKDMKYQLSVLDACAGNGALLEECADACALCRDLGARVENLEAEIAKARNESDYNASMFRKLSDASLSEGEIASLEEEQYNLSHSGDIKELLYGCISALDGPQDEGTGILTGMSDLCRCLKTLSEHIPSCAGLYERAEQARVELKDILDDVLKRDESFSCSPQRLQWVDDRLALLYDLLKRFSAEDESALIRMREDLKVKAFSLDDMEADLESLKKEKSAADDAFKAVCCKLSESRKRYASVFAEEVLRELKSLELEKAQFIVSIVPAPESRSGADAVSFLFSSAPGVPAAPIAKCASGGELSRIMLSLKEVMCRYMKLPSIVFDEIDTGVSGSTADRMGRAICMMGERMQIFAITHLPQVAAKGAAHYLVEKSASGTSIKKLSPEERVKEVARMLSGERLTPEALANARSLIG